MLGLMWYYPQAAGRAPLRRTALVTATALFVMLFATGVAKAEFGVSAFDGFVNADAGGTPFTQAGGHPYSVGTTIDFNTVLKDDYSLGFPVPSPWPEEPTKDVFVDVPPGLVGNPTLVRKCTVLLLSTRPFGEAPQCPPEAQVGVMTVRTTLPGSVLASQALPVYAIEPPPGVAARFGLNVGDVLVTFDAELRSDGDYGLSLNSRNVSEGISILGVDVTLWGTPADPAHDPERWCPGAGSPGCTTTAEALPFLTLPTRCTAPTVGLETIVRTDSWVDPGDFKTASFFSHLPPFYPNPGWPGVQQGPTGCDRLPFRPSLRVDPSSLASPGAAGYAFELTIPQEDDPVTRIAPAHLKKAVVTLPRGVRVSPTSADGLDGCSARDIGLDNLRDPTCPDGSKIGSLTIDTPLLDEQLTGSVYLAAPFDNPSRTLLGIYLVAKGPGLIVKLPGSVSPGGDDGQLIATFDNNPQLPFSKLRLEFNSGDRAPLSNPPTCGTYTTRAEFTSWGGQTATSESEFTTSYDGRGAACPPAQFTPDLDAGTINPAAGASSPFTMTLSRDDVDDEFAAIRDIDMPSGLLASIASVEALCSEGQMRAGTCEESSRIGTVTTAAGPGPRPFAIRGRVYLGGEYKGAPFSLSIVVPAVAGPFDLGTVVVRSAIFVDKRTANLSIVTDPLPTILQGIPLQVRIVNVLIDRPGFMQNPTDCEEQRITATVEATTGRVAQPSVRFQVGNCRALELDPRMRIKVGSRGHLRSGNSTPFETTLRMPRGGSNLERVRVSLPRTLNGRLDVIEAACSLDEFNAGRCEHARAGSAVAITPLLRDPLRGGAYFVDNPDHKLPDLMVALRGQVDFDLVGEVTIPRSNRLETTFPAPDVPITRFTLRFGSGRNGPIGVARNLCTRQARRDPVRLVFTGQNGETIRKDQRLVIAGCPKAKRAKRASKR